MALINREQALSHPFANGQYDKEHADEHFILGFEDYKEWLEDLPTVETIPKADYETRLKADMVAMLTEIQLEIEELDLKDSIPDYTSGAEDTRDYITNMIEETIDKLKGV